MTGLTAVISGGSGDIGRATAWLFARCGASVVLTGRKIEKIEPVVEALTRNGMKATGEVLNVRDRASVDAFWDRQWQNGGADILINSAGGQFPQAALDFTEKGWNTVIDTNLNGTWNMMQSAARKWRDAGRGGSIVNITVVTRNSLHGVAHTVAARAGVEALSAAVSVEWAPIQVRVNCIAPGLIETEGWKVYPPEARAEYYTGNPMMRAGTTWDIAEACAYLSGPSGRFITGEVLTVDGGGRQWGEVWTTGKPAYFRDGGTK
ncbi:MAG: SDR family oxidoreductase [Pseudooceanicola sp.]|nr:SDR family oxidoreductase [Pseudooceanicola sp.]